MRKPFLKNAKNRRRQAGFTLLEVMVAAAVMFISMVCLFGCMTMGLSVTQLSQENLRATQIMLDKMEGVRLYNWTQLNSTNFLRPNYTNWFFETNNIGQAAATGSGVQYTGTVSVASWPFSAAYTTNMRQVTVTIGWVSAKGSIPRSRSMVTFVDLSGLQNYVYSD